MKFIKLVPAVFAALAISLTACGGEDDDNEPVINGSESGVTVNTTVAKEKVASVAKSLMQKFKAEDHADLIKLLEYISETYGEYELDIDEEEYSPFRELGHTIELDLVNNVPTGIYTPGSNHQWVKTENSNNLTFLVPNDPRYRTIELTVKRSGGQSTVNVNIPDEDNYTAIIPAKVTATLAASGNIMISQELETSLNLNNHRLTATETLSAANLRYVTTINGTNTQANVATSLFVNNEQIANATSIVSGSNMCDLDAIISAADDERMEDIIRNVQLSGNVLNQIYLNGRANIHKQLIDAWDSYYEFGYEYCKYRTQAQASLACDNAISTLNRNVSVNVSFTPGGAAEAKLTFIKDGYFWGYDHEYGEYYPEASIEFADGTTYTDEYFDEGFDAVINQWKALVRAYESICD